MIETEFEHERDSVQTGLMLTQFTMEDKQESMNSVCLNDKELEMFVDQQKNCNTSKKTISDLRKWHT